MIDIKEQIVRQLMIACENLGALSDLLAINNGYGEKPDEEFVGELREWNSFGPVAPKPDGIVQGPWK